MNREYLYANWRGGNALLGRVAAMVKVGTTRANLTSQWPHAFLSGIFFLFQSSNFLFIETLSTEMREKFHGEARCRT